MQCTPQRKPSDPLDIGILLPEGESLGVDKEVSDAESKSANMLIFSFLAMVVGTY
jgi:hypothetical protein